MSCGACVLLNCTSLMNSHLFCTNSDFFPSVSSILTSTFWEREEQEGLETKQRNYPQVKGKALEAPIVGNLLLAFLHPMWIHLELQCSRSQLWKVVLKQKPWSQTVHLWAGWLNSLVFIGHLSHKKRTVMFISFISSFPLLQFAPNHFLPEDKWRDTPRRGGGSFLLRHVGRSVPF